MLVGGRIVYKDFDKRVSYDSKNKVWIPEEILNSNDKAKFQATIQLTKKSSVLILKELKKLKKQEDELITSCFMQLEKFLKNSSDDTEEFFRANLQKGLPILKLKSKK